MEPYQGKGHCLYTSHLNLLEHGTYCAGTVKSNHKGYASDLKPNGD